MRKWLLVALALWGTCSFAGIEVAQPQVRLLPPGLPNTSAYFTLTNTGQKDRSLIAVNSTSAKRVEIHNHIMTDGVMRMEKQDKLDIPADTAKELQPGGYHLMLFGLKKPLKENQLVPLALYFADGEVIMIEAVVSSEIGQHHHHH